RARRLHLVRGERRHDAAERRALPPDDPLARTHGGDGADVQDLPRPRPERRAAPRVPRHRDEEGRQARAPLSALSGGWGRAAVTRLLREARYRSPRSVRGTVTSLR